ncbi:MAG: hypothetical protein KF893_04880 [Caldilineaceae bacterium]|nr:hypothetical protein [Caldilineaceae bacterium]
MTTIQLLQERSPQGRLQYRAVYRQHHAEGTTLGAALDALEDALPADSGTVVILQKFKADRFFGEEQQARLAELMVRLEASRAHGHDLAPEEMAELEELVEQELRATTRRAKDIYHQSSDQ